MELDNAHANCTRGRKLLDLGHYEEAIKYFDRAIKFDPDYASAHSGKGFALSWLGLDAEAVPCFDRAIELEPDNADAHCYKGLSLSSLSRDAEAVPCFDRAIELRPDHRDAHYWKGCSLIELGRHKEAIKSLDDAIRWRRREWRDFRHEDEGYEAEELLETDRREDSDKKLGPEARQELADAYHKKGFALACLDCYEEAVPCFDRAIELRPDHRDAHYEMGNTLNKLGRHKEAIKSLDTAIDLTQNGGCDRSKRSEVSSDNDHREDSGRGLDEDAMQELTDAYYVKGLALAELGRHEEAIKCFENAAELSPDDTEVHHDMGLSLIELGRHEDAIKCFEIVTRLEPNHAEAHIARWDTLDLLGRHAEAAECCRRILDAKNVDDKVKAGARRYLDGTSSGK